jgi:hypothetical protein
MIKVLVWIVLLPVLATWVIPCHEDAPMCQGSPSHSDCCGGHSVPCLSSASSEPRVTLFTRFFHPFDKQFAREIFASDIYRPPRA